MKLSTAPHANALSLLMQGVSCLSSPLSVAIALLQQPKAGTWPEKLQCNGSQ